MRTAFLSALGLALIVDGSPAIAVPTAVQRCAAAKLTAVAKATKSVLICRKKAILAGVAVDPSCLAKAETKLAAAFARAEDKGGCAFTDHLPQVQESIDTCVDLFAYLEELPCGDAAGPAGEDLPCACGNVVVTDTTLNAGFDPVLNSSCGGTGLEVASGVTLDLGGGTIGGGGGVGILPEAGTTILGGIVQGFDVGILVRDGNVTLTDVALNGNASSGLIVGQAGCATSPAVILSGANVEVSDNGGTGIVVHPCAALTINGPPGMENLLPVLRNGGIGIDVRGQLTASYVEVGLSASHGVKVESDAPVLLTDCHIHRSGRHPTLPAANGIGIYVLRTAVPASLLDAGFVIHSTESVGRSFVTYNGGHGIALGDLTEQSGPVVASVGDVQMYENEIGIRVQQKNPTTARTEFTILSNNIYNNRDAGLYISTSYQRPTPTTDRRVISSNDIHHNAIVVDGCFPVPGEQVQFASQVVFDGPVMGTDPSGGGASGPDSVAYPDDHRCYSQGGVPVTETQCDRMNDPEDVISGGFNNHCIWTGSQCRLAWDITGTVGTGECGTSDNRIFAYINDPVRPEFTQKGVAATNGAFVLARRNTWGVGGASNGTHAVSGTNSEIDFEDDCGSVSTCTEPSPP